MSQITKKAADFVPAGQTYQVFTQADAGVGDILMVKNSLLGRPAKNVIIDATAALTVKFNVVQKVFPPRQPGEGFNINSYKNLAKEQEYIASGEQTSFALGAGETLELDGGLPISDIMIVAGGTNFTIFVS